MMTPDGVPITASVIGPAYGSSEMNPISNTGYYCVDVIRKRNHELMTRAGAAVVDMIEAMKQAKEQGAPPERLRAAQELQRKAQWRLDFVAAENSMGFHAPQESARILAESIDDGRRGQLIALGLAPAVKSEDGAEKTVPSVGK
jgi:formate-dependent nitrite reductase cytochrome c552 subunit